ncbi:Aste57867_11874 [Aphanomyces stellatus]|uniref:Aste57867_11874 protein n=1 Tax=Aphanomyces stellatus TaxID=120398 RepID=A0A485KUS1_9STRA|nr:hypothetical protein As57867_011829 [Aphanomyces stellatus]VFT88729.1 Aste57867_11874 [Aphanomyces stellatus]
MAGLRPCPTSPFTRRLSLALLDSVNPCALSVAKLQVRVMALCPRETDTDMGRNIKANVPAAMCPGQPMTTAYVAQGSVKCIQDDANSGKSFAVTRDMSTAKTCQSRDDIFNLVYVDCKVNKNWKPLGEYTENHL